MNKNITIENLTIGLRFRPFIVAELSANHNQSLDQALKIVEEAAKAGCHAVKLQTYTADTMTLDSSDSRFTVQLPLWQGRSLHSLYQEAQTPWEWHLPIFEKARSLGMLAFSTPFDETAVEFLESLHVPLYKVSSFEITDLPLLKKIAQQQKPVIVSTGMASLSEIDDAVRVIRGEGNENIILLKCTSAYPAPPENANLLTIPHLRDMHDVIVGLSDHSLGCGVAVAAVALGARVIEKHLCLSRAPGGVDSAFSMEPYEMNILTKECERAFLSLGKISYAASRSESESVQYRRSIYAIEDIKAGQPFTKFNVRVLRPSIGLAPKYLDLLLTRKSNRNIAKGTPICWDLLS